MCRKMLAATALAAALVLVLAATALAQETLWVVAESAAVRPDRSGLSEPAGRLERGAVVRMLGTEGSWRLVRSASGLEGWVYQGHLATTSPPPSLGSLFAPPPQSIILAEAADTGRSSRSTRPTRPAELESLWPVLDMPLTREDLETFLRGGGVGEYAQTSSQGAGALLKPAAVKPAAPSGGEEERQLALNLMVGLIRRLGKPAFGVQLQRYVNLTGLAVARFAPGYTQPCRFVVLENPAPLSFALPGGLVALTTGMLKALDNEAQLALVLAHEVAHASLEHLWARAKAAPFFRSGGSMTEAGVQTPQYAQMQEELLELLLRRGYEPRQEQDADAAALVMAARAGYDPLQMAAVVQNVGRAGREAPSGGPEGTAWTDMHPPLARRLAGIQAALRELPMLDSLALGTERFRSHR